MNGPSSAWTAAVFCAACSVLLAFAVLIAVHIERRNERRKRRTNCRIARDFFRTAIWCGDCQRTEYHFDSCACACHDREREAGLWPRTPTEL